MIWPFLPICAAWLLGAWTTWFLGTAVVGASRFGRQAVAALALLWFAALPVVIVVALLAAFGIALERTSDPGRRW